MRKIYDIANTVSLKGFQLQLQLELASASDSDSLWLLLLLHIRESERERELTGSSSYNNIQHRFPALNTSRRR